MIRVAALHLAPATAPANCSECGKTAELTGGVHLVRAETGEPICRGCGRRQAPGLAALLDLAGTAGRVARIGRQGIFPPFTALLDLARAAENFSDKVLA